MKKAMIVAAMTLMGGSCQKQEAPTCKCYLVGMYTKTDADGYQRHIVVNHEPWSDCTSGAQHSDNDTTFWVEYEIIL